MCSGAGCPGPSSTPTTSRRSVRSTPVAWWTTGLDRARRALPRSGQHRPGGRWHPVCLQQLHECDRRADHGAGRGRLRSARSTGRGALRPRLSRLDARCSRRARGRGHRAAGRGPPLGAGPRPIALGARPRIVVGRFLRGCGVAMAARRLSVVCGGPRGYEPPPTVYNSSHFVVDGRLFVSTATEDFAQTTLLDVSGDEAIEGVSFSGFMGNVPRVR
jgi:hypothetical protein